MALSEDVIALVHDLSSAGLAVTLIGAPACPEDLEYSEYTTPTKDGTDDEITTTKEDDRKKQRYSGMSAEVRPTRDRGPSPKKLSKRIDVRYLNEIKSFKEKIKSSYLLSCNQKQCPMIQERLNQHQQMHHHDSIKTDNSCNNKTKLRDQAVNVSPTLSRMRLPKFNLPLTEEGRVVQTEITMRDFSPNRLFEPKNLNKVVNEVISKEIPLRKSQTREVLPRKNFYKEHLQNEILNWLQTVPMFYTINFTTKDIKDNLINNLAEKINKLAVEAFEKDYESKTNNEIENCLNKLPMWLPGSKREQTLFKDGLREKLWIKIQELNENYLGIRYDKAAGNDKEEYKEQCNESYERAVVDWSLKLQLNDHETSISRRQVVDLIMKRLSPLLKIPLHTTSYKLILKGEIIDILDDLPLTLTSPRFRTVHLNRFAEELANRLLSIQIKHEASNSKMAVADTTVFHQCTSQVMGMPLARSNRCNLKKRIQEKVAECLGKVQVCHRNDLKTEICSSFLDSKDHLRANESVIKNEICQFLRDTGKLSEVKTQSVAKMIMKSVKDAIKDMKYSATTSFDSVIPELSGTISVYRWGDKSFVTSTPTKPSKKEIPKLNAEEKSYMENVAALIRAWMDTLPKQFNEDKKFKEVIINDLAGDIMDDLKLEQLAPETGHDKEKFLNYLMYRWLYRFEIFPDDVIRDDAKPFIADFLKKLKSIPVPQLTAPQHGTRQAMANIQHMEGELGWEEDFLAKGIDVLEDQISVWVNEQPSQIYINNDKKKRDKMVHDLALTLQDRLRNKSPEAEIDKEINQWLKKVVNPTEKEHIGLLSQNLKEKLIHIPQDKTLEARHEKRKRQLAEHIALKKRGVEQPTQPTPAVSNVGNIEGDPDKTIKEFIAKFIEHNYDIDDPMARGAFSHLLKTELRKLSPPTRKEVYDNFEKSTPHEHFLPESLKNELECIKTISDWLNNIPIDPSYNTSGNTDRIDFVNDLAKNIQEIEAQRLQNPDQMDFNYLTASVILQSMHTYGLPILPEHKDNTPIMVDQLLKKLIAKRGPVPCCKFANQSQQLSQSTSLEISDIKEQNLSEFIADYIRINGREIADDEMKLEAWTARLLKEVKKLLHEGADPSTLCKAQVYTKFSEVPIPRDESVRRFSLEMAYVKEISDWLKNLPLLPIANQPQAEEERIKMISELAENMSERETLRNSDPNDDTADKNLVNYVTNWISRLPLDPNKDIVLPILIQQLMNRMERANKRSQLLTETSGIEEQQANAVSSKSVSIDSSEKKNKVKKKAAALISRSSNVSVTKMGSQDKISVSPKSSQSIKGKKNPAAIIVEAIENWSNKLPIEGDDSEEVKSMKEGITRKLYQKIGELNVDPRIFNDDLLYKDMLGDEIDTQLENVPQNSELQTNRDNLKQELLNTIIDTKKIIKERSAGENYKHKLETTIDASIPNPVQSTQAFDPGFEIYKNHLADMFILENFDHANDDVKAKYEMRVRFEIDKYFENARNKNALPLTKDQIYNELYSALFKVPMPNEASVIDEVEQVKTRCEIDEWFEKLPLKEADGVGELLEWDKILSTLTKRIHEIEKSDPQDDIKIHKEITKWLEKLPLLPGNEGIDNYATKLQNTLKSTAEARKYVATESKQTSKGKGKKVKESKMNKGSTNTSQVAGPSSAGQKWTSPIRTQLPRSKATTAKPCCPVSPMSQKKPGDLIVEIVEEWCNQLPLTSNETNSKTIKDNLSTRIIIQISELNMDPEIFNDDVIYDELLDEELESVLSDLPVSPDFEQSKPARKYQFKEMIKSIKPLIREEKARQEYKEELNNTVVSILKGSQDTSADKVALFNKLKDEIVENFVQYNYNKNDGEGRLIYKNAVHDAVVKYCIDIRDKTTEEQVDPLVRRNQLLSELGRIPIPNDTVLKEEVNEIKMKNEVERFFLELSIPEGEAENKMKKHLSKRLTDLEKGGHNCANDKKMKSDISRCLKKLNVDVNPIVIERFVDKLKNNEADRKSPPLTSSQATELNQSGLLRSPRPNRPGTPGAMFAPQAVSYPYDSGIQQAAFTPQNPQQGIYSQDPNQTRGDTPWIALLPARPPPNEESGYHKPYNEEYRSDIQVSPYASDVVDQSIGQTSVSYEDFEGGRLLSSSVAPQTYGAPVHHLGQSVVNHEDFKGGPLLSSSVMHDYGVRDKPGDLSQMSRPQPSHLQQSHRTIREPSLGQGQTQSGYGQVTTPRQVAQAPYQVLHSPHHVSQPPGTYAMAPGDITPESLFFAPVFKPVPLHHPMPVSLIEPSPLPNSAGSMQPSRRTLPSPDNALVPSPKGQLKSAPLMPGHRRSRDFDSSDDDPICKCERDTRNYRGVPYCMVSMEECYDDYIGFSPVWYGLPFPECYYY